MLTITFRSLAILFFVSCLFFNLTAQQTLNPIAKKVKQNEAVFNALETAQFVDLVDAPALEAETVEEVVSNATYLDVQANQVKNLIGQSEEFVVLEIPLENESPMTLQLYRAEVFSPGFEVYTASNPDEPYPYERGIYYWGIANNDYESLVALSITKEEIMGFISINNDTYTIGKLDQDSESTHILYKDKDLKVTPTLECGVDDQLHYKGDGKVYPPAEGTDNCVQMYVEVDYDIFVGKGGVTQAANYVNGAFSQVAILYANESIDFTIKELYVWDVVDPYTGPSTSNYLTQFRNTLNGNYNGDLAHLVGYTGGGGIAYVDVLCNSFYGVGYSDINSTYSNVPTYSWTVEVLTHEIGHNLGSRHTHACVWGPNNNEPLDCCGYNAGYSDSSCGSNYNCTIPNPTNGGTIMSYCHLLGGVGINFNNGFGQEPGDLIRSEVYNAPCLTTCPTSQPDDAGIASIIAPVGTSCANSQSPVVELFNYGSNDLTSVTIEYQVDGGTVNTHNWTGTLASGSSTNVTLSSITYGNGAHTFDANTTSPNGSTDSDASNDSASSNFDRPSDNTYYADNDGDGYGDPNNSLVDCVQPSGYVLDNTDCNDNNANEYPGASCDDGVVCTTGDVLDANCNCSGTVQDSDGDGVCDGEDICPGGDDNIDSDGDGVPDFCDCQASSTSFSANPLTHTGTGSNSTTVNFGAGDKDPSVTISNLGSKTNGNPNGRYIDEVTVSYVDGNGAGQTYGVFSGDQVSTVNVSISGEVQSLTVALADGYDGNFGGTLSVDFSGVDYCLGCTDSDGDGVCDGDDVCSGFDDNLIGTSCDDGDACTINDTWACNSCAGTPTADSDGDGVCDGEDICPGGDDNIDTDGDGIPDFCDNFNCSNEITSTFSPDPLNHQGTGFTASSVSFPANNEDVSFDINDLGFKTNGNPNKRYIDQVTVKYVDGNGATQTYGTFTGNNQSSVSVSISGEVQSLDVELSDAYDGDTGNETISVDLTDVQSCVTPGAQYGFGNEKEVFIDVNMYPNPTATDVYFQFDIVPEKAEIIFRDILGKQIGQYEIENQAVTRIDLEDMVRNTQVVIVTIHIKGQDPLSKRLFLMRQ